MMNKKVVSSLAVGVLAVALVACSLTGGTKDRKSVV